MMIQVYFSTNENIIELAKGIQKRKDIKSNTDQNSAYSKDKGQYSAAQP